jgi:hypothetical protein
VDAGSREEINPRSVQGMLSFSDSSTPAQGGFVAVDRSHMVTLGWLAQVGKLTPMSWHRFPGGGLPEGLRNSPGRYVDWGAPGAQALAAELEASGSEMPALGEPHRVLAPAGSLVLWYSTTAHQGTPPNAREGCNEFRHASYVTYMPRAGVSNRTLAARRATLLACRGSTHNPRKHRAFDRFPQLWSKPRGITSFPGRSFAPPTLHDDTTARNAGFDSLAHYAAERAGYLAKHEAKHGHPPTSADFYPPGILRILGSGPHEADNNGSRQPARKRPLFSASPPDIQNEEEEDDDDEDGSGNEDEGEWIPDPQAGLIEAGLKHARVPRSSE